MKKLKELLERNREWATQITASDPEFFQKLAQQQAPTYLWIGCSDSRVPSTQLVSLTPGEMFVHRNVANIVVHTDFNCLSVIQYAVEVLKVRHIIVCGHYGCGGVQAAMQNLTFGLIDNWLRHVQDVMKKHEGLLAAITDDTQRLNRLCELNVIEQVMHVSQTTILQSAWERGQEIAVHGWIYGLQDGLLRELNICITGQTEMFMAYDNAVAASVQTTSVPLQMF
jgi:carbonic anhydrase